MPTDTVESVRQLIDPLLWLTQLRESIFCMNCPKCETQTLVSTSVRETDVDQCKSCGGIWFDERELGAILQQSATALRPLRSGREQEAFNLKDGHCPRDNEPLMRVYSAQNSTIVVDACPKCRGIWLDGGELNRLVG